VAYGLTVADVLSSARSWGYSGKSEAYKLTVFVARGAVVAWLPKRKSAGDRSSVSLDDLQSAITEAVKKADPDCEAFVGVIVLRETPKAQLDANWGIRGVRFGKADREKSRKALATIVERMQREFVLAPHVPGSADKSGQ
jgi:hypothetical protein